jgi:hypothetical protein
MWEVQLHFASSFRMGSLLTIILYLQELELTNFRISLEILENFQYDTVQTGR